MSNSLLKPFVAAHYNASLLKRVDEFALSDLDSAHSIWGEPDRTHAYRNILVGPAAQRRDTWQAWLSSGVFELRQRPAFFVLQQEFHYLGQARTRWAVLATLPIDDPNIIIHEDVVSEGVERARQATECCEADIAPIFVGYDENKAAGVRGLLQSLVLGKPALLTFVDKAATGERHTIWLVEDAEQIAKIQASLEGEKFFLLDGHHRLAAAKANKRQGLGDSLILACICSLGADDTLILPIHRLVHYRPWMILDSLVESFVRLGCKVQSQAAVQTKNFEHQLASFSLSSRSCLVLNAHSDQLLRLEFQNNIAEQPLPLADLAVAHLEYYLEKRFAAATVIPAVQTTLALEQLALDQAHVAFFLPPLRADQIKTIAMCGIRLPRKSTRFVPKPALGLLARPWGL